MAQQWVDLSSTNTFDRLTGVPFGAIHLSDGTLVFLDYDGTNTFLKYSSDHVTINTIASLPWTVSTGYALCRDASDNLYVLACSTGTTLAAKAFTKGAGYTWTGQTPVTQVVHAYINPTAVWCNTGGGTGSHGHILLIGTQGAGSTVADAIVDAGVLLAGTGTLVTQSSASPAFLGTSSTATGPNLDLDPDGFGATSGVSAAWTTSTTLTVGHWAVSSTGTLSTNAAIGATITVGTMSATTKVRVIRYASNAWAVIAPSTTAGRYMIARYSSTAQLTAPTDSGAPTNMPLNGAGLGWDAALDPVVANQIWIYSPAAVSAGQQQMWRVSVGLGSGVTVAGAATADDLLTNTAAATSSLNMRAVKQPTTNKVDWQIWVKATSTNWALDGDYTSFSVTHPITVSATAATTATLTRQVGRKVSATVATSVGITRQVGRTVKATVTTAATVGLSRLFNRTVAATVNTAATVGIIRLYRRVVSATVGTSAALSRTVAHSVSATVATTVAVTRRVARTVSATVSTTAVTLRRLAVTVAATVGTSATVTFVQGLATRVLIEPLKALLASVGRTVAALAGTGRTSAESQTSRTTAQPLSQGVNRVEIVQPGSTRSEKVN